MDPPFVVKYTEADCLLFQGRAGPGVSSHLTQEINGSLFHIEHQSVPLQGQCSSSKHVATITHYLIFSVFHL